MKRIDETYKWKNPTIVDRDPELLAYLKPNPKYQDARCYRIFTLNRGSAIAKQCFFVSNA
jgi:hypothetical protein